MVEKLVAGRYVTKHQAQGYGLADARRLSLHRRHARAQRDQAAELCDRSESCGKSLAGYGVLGKANTLLNYCGIRTDFLDYAVDRNPYDQGKYLPGTHIPIFPPEKISETRPDYVLILPWDLKDEIMSQLTYIRSWGAKFVVPIPEVSVF
jgi:hypothetical protein